MILETNKHIKLFDKLFSVFIFETIFLILPFLILWWSFYLLKWNIEIGVIISFLITIFLNLFLIKKIISNFYDINKYILILIHMFYSICIFGFFMGVPIFNVIPGIVGGIYIARKAIVNNENKDKFNHNLIVMNIYSSLVLLVICICSAYIALSDHYTASNLEGMLNINFQVTNLMIWIIIIAGGIALILIQYIASSIVSKRIYNTKKII